MALIMEPTGLNSESDNKKDQISKIESEKENLRQALEKAENEEARNELRKGLIIADLRLIPLEFSDKNDKGEEVKLPGYNEAMSGVYKRAVGQFMDQIGRFEIDIARAKKDAPEKANALEARKKIIENQAKLYEFALVKLQLAIGEEKLQLEKTGLTEGSDLEKAQKNLIFLKKEKILLEDKKQYYQNQVAWLEVLIQEGGKDTGNKLPEAMKELDELVKDDLPRKDREIAKAEEDVKFESMLKEGK